MVLDNWKEVGLLKPSVARVHRLSAMLEDDLLEEIGTVDAKYQKVIKESIKALLNL